MTTFHSLPTQPPVGSQSASRVPGGALVPSPGCVDSFVPPSAKGAPGLDAETVARAQAGDRDAFDAVFAAYHTAIFNYVYRLMGSAEDAYDLTQDAFVRAWLNLTDPRSNAHNDPELRVQAWLYRIATNVCLDELRHRQLVKWTPWEAFVSVFHPAQVAKDSPERDAVAREDAEEVQAILDRLHPKSRLCLILFEYHDLSYDEIARVLTTTRAAVKSLLFRAREEFRRLYRATDRKPGRPRADPESPKCAAVFHFRPRPAHAGAQLANRRRALGIAMHDLARHLGCPNSTLSLLERHDVGEDWFRQRVVAALNAYERELGAAS